MDRNRIAMGVLAVIVVVGVGVGINNTLKYSEPPAQPPPPPSPACAADWTKCKDNDDFMGASADRLAHIQHACYDEFGKNWNPIAAPYFPTFRNDWRSFDTYVHGDDFPRTGVVVLYAEAIIHDALGNLVHRMAICKFDLRTDSVVSHQIVEGREW